MPAFDTDIVSSITYGDEATMAKMAHVPPNERIITIITVTEILRGVMDAINREHDKSLKGKANFFIARCADIENALTFFQTFHILPYDERAEAIFQAFPNEVKRGKANDCRIAAAAMVHGPPIATRNIRDFGKIPGANVESWQ